MAQRRVEASVAGEGSRDAARYRKLGTLQGAPAREADVRRWSNQSAERYEALGMRRAGYLVDETAQE